MGAIKTAGAALGKLFKNIKNPQWHFEQAAQQGISIFVINPLGNKAVAYVKGHILHMDQKVADVYHCADGHEYFRANGKTYNHDLETDTWYDASHNG